jgi:hypothetical protein
MGRAPEVLRLEPFGGVLQRQVTLGEAMSVARVVAAELRRDYSPAMCPSVADVGKFAAAFEEVYPGYGGDWSSSHSPRGADQRVALAKARLQRLGRRVSHKAEPSKSTSGGRGSVWPPPHSLP